MGAASEHRQEGLVLGCPASPLRPRGPAGQGVWLFLLPWCLPWYLVQDAKTQAWSQAARVKRHLSLLIAAYSGARLSSLSPWTSVMGMQATPPKLGWEGHHEIRGVANDQEAHPHGSPAVSPPPAVPVNSQSSTIITTIQSRTFPSTPEVTLCPFTVHPSSSSQSQATSSLLSSFDTFALASHFIEMDS